MDDATENATAVVAEIRTDAAAEVAAPVIDTVIAAEQAVMSGVVHLDNQLTELADENEERHTEILEGQEWQERQFQLTNSLIASMQGQITTVQTQLTAFQAAVLAILERPPIPSTDSSHSIPSMEIPTVEPAPVAEENQEAKTEPTAIARKRKVI